MNLRIKIIQTLIDINERIFFYPKLRAFYKKNCTSSRVTVIDVGANKGQSIDFFTSIFKNIVVYAFEPNPMLFQKLLVKYKNKKNIHLFNMGVSNINGTLELKETVTDETSTFEELNFESKYLQMKSNVLGVKKENLICKKYSVEVITLYDFIQKIGISSLDILKIDTEGHEYKCLLGLFSSENITINFIQLESHNDDMYIRPQKIDEIPNLLLKEGFNSCTMIKHGFGDFNECIYEKKQFDAK